MREYYMQEMPTTDAMVVTNADRVRAMTDEELAEMLGSGCVCDICGYDDGGRCSPPFDDSSCAKGILAWLQQPAEEG